MASVNLWNDGIQGNAAAAVKRKKLPAGTGPIAPTSPQTNLPSAPTSPQVMPTAQYAPQTIATQQPHGAWGYNPPMPHVTPTPTLPSAPTSPQTQDYHTDWGGGNLAQQQQQVNDARSPGAPLPLGVDPAKWYDQTKGTSNKYTGLGVLSGGGSIADILHHPQFAGWSQVGSDKVKGPDGSVYDVKNGPTGQPQWTAVSGPAWDLNGIPGVNSLGVNSSMAHDGIKGNYAAANTAAADAAKAAGHSTFGYATSPGGGSASTTAPLGGQFSGNEAGGQDWMNPGSGMPATGATGTGYGDPNADLFANEVLSRLQSLHTPQTDPFRDMLQKAGLDRVDSLNGAPYTAGEDAALRAQYMDPLAQARDAEMTRRKEELGQRGYLPSSGLFQQQMNDISQGYQSAVGKSSNDLAVRAIDEKQRRSQEQLQILSNLLGVSTDAQAATDARGREAVTTANLLPAMDERRLGQMLSASNTSQDQGSLMSTLTSLMQMNQQNSQFNANQQQQNAMWNQQQGQQNSQAWGQYLGYLMQNWDSIFGAGK